MINIVNYDEKMKGKIKTIKHTPLLTTPLPCNFLLCGKKKSGKSNVLLNMCEGKDSNGVKIMPNEHIYVVSHNHRDPKYKYLIKKFKKKITYDGQPIEIEGEGGEEEQPKEEEEESKPLGKYTSEDIMDMIRNNNHKNHFLVVFDDFIGDNKLTAMAEQFAKEHRHFGCSACYLSQYLYSVKPKLRVNMDYLMLFRMGANNNKVYLKRAYDETFSNDFKDYSEFKQLYDYCIPNYGFLFCDMDNKHLNLKYRKGFDTSIILE